MRLIEISYTYIINIRYTRYTLVTLKIVRNRDISLAKYDEIRECCIFRIIKGKESEEAGGWDIYLFYKQR